MADIKRVNYFTHQFLVEKDFDDEQDYHNDMRRRHNRVNHSWGVAKGLDVTKTKDKEVAISKGTAIDKDGQEIVLLEPLPVDLTAFGSNTDVYLSISYQEVFDEADHYTSGGIDNYTRTTERPKLESSSDAPDPLPGDGSFITLARVHLDGSGNVGAGVDGVGIDGTMRKPAGSKIAPGAVSTNELANNAVTGAKIANGQVGASELANGSVTNTKLANNAVTATKIKDNSITAAKIANGHVGTSELANDSVSAQKLKTKLYWDATTSIVANGTKGFNTIAVPLTKPRGASLLIYAYSTTNKAKFEWREQSTTGGSSPYWINQSVYFHNLSNITISIRFKIYEILEA